jgi:RND superfamily putative drug exporter
MLGLGLAVDYALLVVSRFREERAVDPDVLGSIERTYATAGRTVAFSGLTVAASLAGLLVFPDDFLRSMGLAGLAVVLLAMVAALTLLPALLAVGGSRIRPGRAATPSGPSRPGVFVRWPGSRVAAPCSSSSPYRGRCSLQRRRSSGSACDRTRRRCPPRHRLGSSPRCRGTLRAVRRRRSVTVVLSGNVPAAALDTYTATLRGLDGAATCQYGRLATD